MNYSKKNWREQKTCEQLNKLEKEDDESRKKAKSCKIWQSNNHKQIHKMFTCWLIEIWTTAILRAHRVHLPFFVVVSLFVVVSHDASLLPFHNRRWLLHFFFFISILLGWQTFFCTNSNVILIIITKHLFLIPEIITHVLSILQRIEIFSFHCGGEWFFSCFSTCISIVHITKIMKVMVAN